MPIHDPHRKRQKYQEVVVTLEVRGWLHACGSETGSFWRGEVTSFPTLSSVPASWKWGTGFGSPGRQLSSLPCTVILEFLNGYQPATTVNPRGHHREIRISPGGSCLSGWPFASKQSLHAFSLNAKNALLLGIYEAGVWKLVFKFVWPGVGVRGWGRKGVLLEDPSPGESSRNAPNLESVTLNYYKTRNILLRDIHLKIIVNQLFC